MSKRECGMSPELAAIFNQATDDMQQEFMRLEASRGRSVWDSMRDPEHVKKLLAQNPDIEIKRRNQHDWVPIVLRKK